MSFVTSYLLLKMINSPLSPLSPKPPVPRGKPVGPICTERVPLAQTAATSKRETVRHRLTGFFRRLPHRSTGPKGAVSHLPDNEPDWLIQRRRNLTNSPLCRLPVELLLEIKSYLSPATIFVLCHTSALFFPLLDRNILDELDSPSAQILSDPSLFKSNVEKVEVFDLL